MFPRYGIDNSVPDGNFQFFFLSRIIGRLKDAVLRTSFDGVAVPNAASSR